MTRKILKTSYNARQQSSPLRISNRNPSFIDNSRNSEYLKVKVDVTENEHAKDLEALKKSYQQ